MKVFLNRTQLARRLNIAPETLRSRIDAKEIKPDGKDGLGADLFSLASVESYLSEHRAMLKNGGKMPKGRKP